MRKTLFLLLSLPLLLKAQISGPSLPRCENNGDTFVLTTAPAGQNLYTCKQRAWTVVGGSSTNDVVAQSANGADAVSGSRFTDTSPTGNFLHFLNAASNADLWTVDVAGILQAGTVPNARTTAASTNTASAIVTRDSSGNFAAGTITAALTGNASTATALAANGSNCSAGTFPLGVDASGASESCTALPTTLTGTANQITVSAATGAITVSIPTSPTLPGTTTGTFSGALTGNSSTATALAANGANCSAGSYPLGVDASGAVESCTVAATVVLTGTSASIGGGLLTVGTCASGTASVTGATTSMAVSASPVTYPGDGNYWVAYVSSSNTVTVKVCATATLTPTASTYNVRVQ